MDRVYSLSSRLFLCLAIALGLLAPLTVPLAQADSGTVSAAALDLRGNCPNPTNTTDCKPPTDPVMCRGLLCANKPTFFYPNGWACTCVWTGTPTSGSCACPP